MPGLSRQPGFTLTELVIALSLVAILTLVAIPSIRSTIREHRVITTTEALFDALQYAKSEAIKRNTNVYVSFSTGSNWCYGINTGSSCTCSTAGNCNLGSFSAPNSQQLTLSTTGLNSNSVYFESSHGAASTTGTATFTTYGASSPLMTVSIGRLGYLQLCSTGINGYTGC